MKPCKPHRGQFYPGTDIPLNDNGRPLLPGIRVCGAADCVEPSHIAKTAEQAKAMKMIPRQRPERTKTFSVPGEVLNKLAKPRERYDEVKSCAVPECPHPTKSAGLCSGHAAMLWRWRKAQGLGRIRIDYSVVLKAAQPPKGNRATINDHYCHVPDCTRAYEARGLCGLHYQRYLRAQGATW